METKPEVVNLINQVSQDTIESHIRYMQGFIRDCRSEEALIVQNWLVENFESYGYEDVSIHYFSYNSQQLDAGNVVVVKKGTEFPDEYILITSHYDAPVGPGADDNASGTAGVLECARLLKDFPTKRSIMFVPFNAEEPGIIGSFQYAQKCATENINIIAHFNMDMIGWFPPDSLNLIMASGYSYISKALFEYYQQTANIYIPSIPTIRFSTGDLHGGDHMPFNVYEYISLYIGDYEYIKQNSCYHKSCDTIGPYEVGVHCGVNRLDLAKAFVQTVLAASAELANAWLPPQNLSACSGIDKITVSWDNNNESSSYKIYRNDTLIGETTETFYVDYDVEIGEKYEYYVIAINQENGQESEPSNKDAVTFVEPLKLPYFNNFSENKYGFEQSDWVRRVIGVQQARALCNTGNSGLFPDNYLSIAELDWFTISHSTNDISIRFRWGGTIRGVVNTWGIYDMIKISNAGVYFEVTNDRKTWHKLAYMSGANYSNLIDYEFSLNDYKGSDFFQARFRLESSGSDHYSFTKIAYITDIEIGEGLGIDDTKKEFPYISSFNFSPNPANNHINIVTNQYEPYHIAIYDMTGRVVFAQEGFNDGMLSVDCLKEGTYFIVVSTKHHRIARKLVIQ